MPTRWLSVSHRNRSQHHENPESNRKQQGFDFAFSDISSARTNTPDRTFPPPRSVQPRPTTSGGSTGKRKLPVGIPSNRPQTSHNRKALPLQTTNVVSNSDYGLIGVAFGSPGHPPSSFAVPTAEYIDREDESSRHCTHFTETSFQMQSIKWKKLGTLFKTRQVAISRDDVPSGPTVGLPTGLIAMDKSPTSQSDPFAEHRLQPLNQVGSSQREPPRPLEDNKPVIKHGRRSEDNLVSRPSTATGASAWDEPYARPPIPKLELDIPMQPLDRFSIMFQNLPAARRSSSLLARRSKTLESLRSFDDSRPNTSYGEDAVSKADPEILTPLMPPKPLNTPTPTRSPAASKYSLFPTASPAPAKGHGGPPVSNRGNYQLKRTASSPACLSPMQNHFSFAKPGALNPKRTESSVQIVSSPEDNTASTDRDAPWSAAHSFQSSVSSATTTDEIFFFDIKSFRDSKGVEDGQFVMTRPDSAAVELARTMSKKVGASSRLRQVEISPQSDNKAEQSASSTPNIDHLAVTTSSYKHASAAPTTTTDPSTTKHTSVNTAYFDEAIAAVERLTSPTSWTEEKVPPLTFPMPPITIATHTDKQPSQPVSSHNPSDLRILPNNKSREDANTRLIPSPSPSPAAEVKEGASPRSDTTTPTGHHPQQPVAVLPHVSAIKLIDRPIGDSPTIPQSPFSPPIRRVVPAAIVSLFPSTGTGTGTGASASATAEDDKPPPVPKKDSKFVPLSKYAARSTVSRIEKQTGVVIPTRPARSNTDNTNLIRPPARSPSMRVAMSKERSATMPSSSSLQGLEKTVPPPSTNKGPAQKGHSVHTSVTEVSVARTVSMSRKQTATARVVVPRRVEGANETTDGLSGNGGSGSEKYQRHRHRRSTSKSQSRDKVTKREQPSDREMVITQKMAKEARKWEVLEKRAYSPVIVQARSGHKPGLSVGLVVESV